MWIVVLLIVAHVVVMPLGFYFTGQLVSDRVPLPVLVVLAVVTLAGLGLTSMGMLGLQQAAERRAWPQVQGEVMEARVVGDKRVWVSTGTEEAPIEDDKFDEETPENVRGDRNLRPEITYTYSVDGEPYERVTNLRTPGFGGTLNRLDVGIRTIAEYPPGRQVTVFYDPVDPGISYLRPGATWDAYMQVSAGLFFYGVALGALSFGVRQRRQAAAAPA